MARTKKMDADTVAALEVVKMEKAVALNAEDDQKRQVEQIKEVFEMIGKIKVADAFQKIARGGNLMWLKEVKERKLYRDIPEIGTWQKFCDYVGLSRGTIDEDLQNFDALGEELFSAGRNLKLDRASFRKLRSAVTTGTMAIDTDCVVIGEDRIPLSADHMEDLKEALEQVIEAKDKIIEEKDATIKAKDRVAQEKEKMIQKQAKEIAKYEGATQKKGFKPGEEALLKKIEALKTTFDGFYGTIDPEDNPMLEGEGATDRVKAAYVGVVAYMRKCVQAVYDTASLVCGVPDDDDFEIPEDMRA